MLKGVPGTGRKFTLQHFADLYGLPRYCIVNYHKAGYDLDDPVALLARILAQKRKPPNLETLARLASGAEGAHKPVKVNGGNGHKLPAPPKCDLNDGRTAIARQAEWFEAEVERTRGEYLAETRPADRVYKFRILCGLIATSHKLSRAVRQSQIDAGNSLKKSEVDKTWARTVAEFRSVLGSWPARISAHPMFRKIDSDAVEELVRSEIEAALRVFDVDPLA